VLVAHLKSKLPTRLDPPDREPLHAGDADALGSALSTIRRAAEAAALRLVCNDLLRDGQRAVVLLGDLNDGHRSVTTELIAGPHRYRLFAASRAGEQASRGMYAAATLQLHRSQRDVYYTYIHEGAHESLDHILVSQHFYDYSRERRWSFREMRVLNDHLDDPRRQATHASDHAPVVATFDHNPA
jgi:predicted extracellular nuclease